MMYFLEGNEWDGHEDCSRTKGSTLESIEGIVNCSIWSYKDYFAVQGAEMCGCLTGFYTKRELKKFIDELQEMHDKMVDTDKHPTACEDIDENFEFEEKDEE